MQVTTDILFSLPVALVRMRCYFEFILTLARTLKGNLKTKEAFTSTRKKNWHYHFSTHIRILEQQTMAATNYESIITSIYTARAHEIWEKLSKIFSRTYWNVCLTSNNITAFWWYFIVFLKSIWQGIASLLSLQITTSQVWQTLKNTSYCNISMCNVLASI